MGEGACRLSHVRTRVIALLAVAVLTAGCTSGTSSGGSATTRQPGSGGSSAGEAATSQASSTTGAEGSSPTTSSSGASTTSTTSTTSAGPTDELSGASEGPRSAPASGDGTAHLRAVRVGRHDAFVRVVFEFSGSVRPGYRIEWTKGPVTSDGSGEPVQVKGDDYLQVIMEPASGVDLDTGTPSYTGPDRIAVAKGTPVLADLVRTGDFEAVLTWVAGARAKVPYRVTSYSSPARLVIDLSTLTSRSTKGS